MAYGNRDPAKSFKHLYEFTHAPKDQGGLGRKPRSLLDRKPVHVTHHSQNSCTVCYASRLSFSCQRLIEQFMQRVLNSSNVVTRLVSEQTQADQIVNFKVAQLDGDTANSVAPALAIQAHAFCGG